MSICVMSEFPHVVEIVKMVQIDELLGEHLSIVLQNKS